MKDGQAEVMVGPIVEAMNIEVIKLDYNHLGGEFLERLCSKMIKNPV
jgi:hypothetical protein